MKNTLTVDGNLCFQLCSGVDENAVGAFSELIFAPIDELFPDDAPLLPSGFRVIPLDSKSVRQIILEITYFFILTVSSSLSHI